MPITEITPYWRAGTASIANGFKSVTGTGTDWDGNVEKGDQFFGADGRMGIVDVVNSDTSLTLLDNWPGTTQSGGVYSIYRISDSVRLENFSQRMINLLTGTTLSSLGGLDGTGGNKGVMLTADGVAATFALTSQGRALLDDASFGAMLTTLGISTFVKTILDDADASAVLSTLGVSTFAKTILDDADAATVRATIGLDDGWQTISKVAATGVAQIDFTNLGAYRALRATIRTLPASDGAVLLARVSADNGANFNATSGAYAIQRTLSESTNLTAINSNTQTGFNLRGGGNAADEGQSGTLTLYNFGPTGMVLATLQMAVVNTSGALELWTGAGVYVGLTTLNALRFVMSTGNIADAFITLEGIKG